MLLDRVVQALNLNLEAMDDESKLQSHCNEGYLVSDYDNFTPVTNMFLVLGDQSNIQGLRTRYALYLVEWPTLPSDKMTYIILVFTGGGGAAKAAAQIASVAAKSGFAPLLDTACERLVVMLRKLLNLVTSPYSHVCYEQLDVVTSHILKYAMSNWIWVKKLSRKYLNNLLTIDLEENLTEGR
ncbi:hypothetical protein L1987_37764 [Smallanthus sonchifolius]|uniref:Uncharacterized protein n=1 Tax=Smallanthus sonchifolius TaxID=185202 RepID=A0ACB9HH20_9ASTR|nr:hypothetical protein L1987_37764 [Smallanthus sonchifolius]